MPLATFTYIVSICSGVAAILALSVMLVKPLRNRFFDFTSIREGQKCLLRSDMLRTYYKHLEDEKIRQHEYENFMYDYAAYKALGGNSFIEHVKKEVDSWSVIP